MSSRDKPCMEGDVKGAIMELGKYYYYYLEESSHPVSITYGDVPLVGIDILQSDEDKKVREHSYKTSIARDTSSQLEYRIVDDNDTLRKFISSTKKPFSTHQAPSRHHGVQNATVRIYDIDTPNDASDQARRLLDKKIWVKIGKTYIFNEHFPLNGHPNIRVVIELTNEVDNEFGYFISTDANKSNSVIDDDFKKRLSDLVKYTEKTYFSIATRKISVPENLKHEAWETHIGDTLTGVCDCFREITVWKYDAILKDNPGPLELDNIQCVCKECGKGAIRE